VGTCPTVGVPDKATPPIFPAFVVMLAVLFAMFVACVANVVSWALTSALVASISAAVCGFPDAA
jgi:hypothetical protein